MLILPRALFLLERPTFLVHSPRSVGRMLGRIVPASRRCRRRPGGGIGRVRKGETGYQCRAVYNAPPLY